MTIDWNRVKKTVPLSSNHGAQGPVSPSNSRTTPQTGSANPKKSGHQREISDTSQLLKTQELQDQWNDFNETRVALINNPFPSGAEWQQQFYLDSNW